MRADAAGARTWLLGALALWALVFWVLALAGLGTRIERLPSDAALRQPLPSPPPPAQERLGPFPQYAAIGDRPLFTDNRQPQPFFLNAESTGEQNTFDYILTSVLITPGLQMAIVRPTNGGEPVRLKVGESPDATPAWSLMSVSPRSVVFAGPDGNRTLALRVYDGIGGEAPTAVTVPRATGPAGAAPPTGVRGPEAVAGAGEKPASPASMAAPAQPPAAPAQGVAPVSTPDAQIEAIRQRIEARRAQLRRQAQQPPQPIPAPAPDESP